MSVIIKGIKKPGNCKECQFFSWSRCYADLTIRFWNFLDENLEIKFEPIGNCPLIELPEEHGDFIDRDELRKKKWTITWDDGKAEYYNAEDIEAAPAVIPAEVRTE